MEIISRRLPPLKRANQTRLHVVKLPLTSAQPRPADQRTPAAPAYDVPGRNGEQFSRTASTPVQREQWRGRNVSRAVFLTRQFIRVPYCEALNTEGARTLQTASFWGPRSLLFLHAHFPRSRALSGQRRCSAARIAPFHYRPAAASDPVYDTNGALSFTVLSASS